MLPFSIIHANFAKLSSQNAGFLFVAMRKLLKLCVVFYLFLHGELIAQPLAQKGIILLKDWNFEKNNVVKLHGEWLFFHDVWRAELASQKSLLLPVPSDWHNVHTGHTGTYQLSISLPKTSARLYLAIRAMRSAGKVWINGKEVGEVGKVGKDLQTEIASAKNFECPLPTGETEVLLQIEVSNFHHAKSGLLYNVQLCTEKHLQKYILYETISLGFLLGVLILGCLIHGLLYIFLRSEKYLLYCALMMLDFGIHILCLATRPLYDWVGDANWHIAYRVELATIVLGLIFGLKFYAHLFAFHEKLRIFLKYTTGVMFLETAGITCLPTPTFTYFDFLISVNLILTAAALAYINVKAIQAQQERNIWLLVTNLLLFSFFLRDNFVLNQNVAQVEWFHVVIILYLLAVSLILMRKIALVVSNEKKIAEDLKATTTTLEFQNIHLEQLVKERSEQLMEAEKQSHQLKLDMKGRDMDMLTASNQIKVQLVKNLVVELENLPKEEKQLHTALNSLINRLKTQNNVEDKLEALSKDMERVNAEFHSRLATRFPELSKTERELCAYIKLNMSNKEIAELRNTSLNTINVTRSRLRKKLGLARDEELESFIQQF